MEVRHLSVKVGDENILKDVSFKVEPQALNVIVGKNGVGKTLLLDRLSRLEDQGEEALIDFPLQKEIVYQTQGVPFIYEATVEQTIKLIGDLAGGHEIMTSLPANIAKNLTKPFGKLSSGEKRYVIIWSILNVDKRLYLLDEPFANLAPSVIRELTALLYSKVAEGKTIIMTSHQFELLQEKDTHIVVLKEGQVTFEGEMPEFKKQFQTFQDLFDDYL